MSKLSVVQLMDGLITSIKTFEVEGTNPNNPIIKEAEDFFWDIAKENGAIDTEKEKELYIEMGFFGFKDYCVQLFWH
jgi:hypothetical protein